MTPSRVVNGSDSKLNVCRNFYRGHKQAPEKSSRGGSDLKEKSDRGQQVISDKQ